MPSSGREPRIEVAPEDPLLVRVVDTASSQATVSVPLDPEPEDLVAENRRIPRVALAHISV